MNGQSHYYYSTNYDLKNTNKKIMKKILIIDDETITIHIIKFILEDNCSLVVRPSGTEPKLKIYISVSANDKNSAEKVEMKISDSAERYLK